MNCPHCGKEFKLPMDEVVKRYSEGKLSLGHAALLADVSYVEMIQALQGRSIPLRFGPTSLAEAEAEEGELLAVLKKRGTASARSKHDGGGDSGSRKD